LLAGNICPANIFLDALQLFVLEETDDSEQREEGAILLNKTVLHPFSAIKSKLLIIGSFLWGL
jgi:hypothetical protein